MTGPPRPPAAPQLPNKLSHQAVVVPEAGSELLLTGAMATGANLTDAQLEYAELSGCRFEGGTLASSAWHRGTLVDCALTAVDLANAVFAESSWQRLTLERCRLTGIDLSGCTVENAAVDGSAAEWSNWRFSTLRRVRFEGCALASSDWTAATLTEVTFADCDLTGATFREAQLSTVRFERCTLVELVGITGLAGSVIDPLNVLDLGYQFAAALGIGIETGAQ